MKSKLSNAIILALAILGGLFLVLTVYFAMEENNTVGYVRDDVEIKQDYTAPVSNVSDYIGYEAEEAFVEGCRTSGASTSACQCMFDYLDSTMTNQEFWDFADLDSIENHPITKRAISACI